MSSDSVDPYSGEPINSKEELDNEDNLNPSPGEKLTPETNSSPLGIKSLLNPTSHNKNQLESIHIEEVVKLSSLEDNPFETDGSYRRPRKKANLAGNVQNSAFSLRNRVTEEDSSRNSKKANTGSEDAPEWLKSGGGLKKNLGSVPSWVKENQEKKLKRPKRRGDVQEQARKARELRQKEIEKLKKQEEEEKRYENVNDIVRSHYNQRTYQAKGEKRQDSQIYKLRNFNNVLKYMLIGKYSLPGDLVLDIACGKGGDLFKWQKVKVSCYVGVDISPTSIEEAVTRYRSIKHRNFEAFFATCDAFGGSIDEALSVFPPGAIKFPVDIVSTQFALHYAFESEEKIRTSLANISRYLRVGGHFIGTIPSSDFIKNKVQGLKEGEKKWGNSLYHVDFINPPPKNGVFAPPYGHKYLYYLKDAVDNVPEYVVPFESLRSLAEEYDLELRYKKSFFELYNEEIPKWYLKLSPKLLNGLKRSDGKLGLEGEDKQAAEFYLAFAFEKTGYK